MKAKTPHQRGGGDRAPAPSTTPQGADRSHAPRAARISHFGMATAGSPLASHSYRRGPTPETAPGGRASAANGRSARAIASVLGAPLHAVSISPAGTSAVAARRRAAEHRARHPRHTTSNAGTASPRKGFARNDNWRLMIAAAFVLVFAVFGAAVGLLGDADHPGLAAVRPQSRLAADSPNAAADALANASAQVMSDRTPRPPSFEASLVPTLPGSPSGPANASARRADRTAGAMAAATATANATASATTASPVTGGPEGGLPHQFFYFDGRPIRPVRTVNMLVTAYSPDARSCAPFDDGITASGKSVWTNGGKLIAADKMYKFGTLMSVPGYNGGRPTPVLDRGGAIKGNRLDVLYPTHNVARQWGVQRVTVTIWEYAD